MTFKVNLRQRAKEITEQVWHKTKVPMQDQVLQLGSKTLKSQRTLSSYGIDKETTIHFTLKVVKPTDEQLPWVLVEPGDEEQRHDLQVRRSSSVAQDDYPTIAETSDNSQEDSMSQTNEATLYYPQGSSRNPIVQVTVHSEEWKPMTFPAHPGDRVNKIKEHVRSKTRVPVQDQVLQLGSKTLKPQRTLSSYGIDKETTIHLTLKVVKPSDEELPLVLVEPGEGGQRHELQVRRSSLVTQVKEMIKMKTAIPPKNQIVNCNGKKLEDGKIMGDYGIKKGHLLFMTYPCIGGGHSVKEMDDYPTIAETSANSQEDSMSQTNEATLYYPQGSSHNQIIQNRVKNISDHSRSEAQVPVKNKVLPRSLKTVKPQRTPRGSREDGAYMPNIDDAVKDIMRLLCSCL
uniref:Ubiquitin D n=1 Tax=Bos indicus x Bos taurus TaxID=30522 RepID=A0A4W2FTH4_BOBOX